ncbi:MAG: 6-carboxytetrahydropterin synthase [Bdellovibrionota bacterium]
MRSGISFKLTFSSAHFYAQPKWSAEKNLQEFGKCFTPMGHGHNYVLEIDCEANAEAIKAQAKKVVETLDHQHLNFVIPEFKDVVPTTENIAIYISKKIKEPLPAATFTLRLFEMDNLWTEIQN